MTELDTALEKYIGDDKNQSEYYELVLKSDFYLPIAGPEANNTDEVQESVTPLIFDSEGKSYLMLFDCEERLTEWSKEPVTYAIIAGFKLAEISTPELYWAVNVGSEFVPEEISWLKDLTK